MKKRSTIGRFLAGFLMGMLIVLTVASRGWSQSERRRPVIVLPRATAGTPLSAQIDAEAKYLVTRGALVESVAVARKIHAEAYAQELENSVNEVDAYFRRRELNRQWREGENTTYLEHEQKRQEVRKMRMEKQFEDVLKGNLTEELNWLLVELSGPTLALHYAVGNVSSVDWGDSRTDINARYAGGEVPLEEIGEKRMVSSSDAALIRFSDGHVAFSANDPKLLQTDWPWALRTPAFDTLRKEFDAAREKLLKEISPVSKEGQVRFESGERLIKSLDAMLVALDKAYPAEKRAEPADFLQYNMAKRYLRSLTGEAQSAIRSGNRAIDSGAVMFQGGSVLELIRHMDRTGLVFAPPPPGGERVYRSLLSSMRSFYLTWGEDKMNIKSENLKVESHSKL
jgi:hypothetical protein